MLRDTHGPEHTNSFCFKNHVGHILQSFYGQAGAFRGKLQREGLEALAILIESSYPLINEVSLRHPVIDQIPGDSRQPDEIGSRSWTQEDVGATRHFMFAQIGDD